MDKAERPVEATNRKQWLALMVIFLALLLFALLWKHETLLLHHRITLVSVCILACGYSFCHAMYSATMDCNGVSCYYFGKLKHSISWNQVEEVAVIRDHRISLGSSGNSRIVVIPRGCPTYDSKRWFGLQYIYRFRTQVIWMDATRHNRKFIEEQYGAIVNYR